MRSSRSTSRENDKPEGHHKRGQRDRLNATKEEEEKKNGEKK
jgi:hypothetical protein